jgi:hypothetical protein
MDGVCGSVSRFAESVIVFAVEMKEQVAEGRKIHADIALLDWPADSLHDRDAKSGGPQCRPGLHCRFVRDAKRRNLTPAKT